MKLLLITQKVNKNDSNLGFFHEWLKKIGENVEHLFIICLEKGEHDLPPEKFTILSLGKENGVSRFVYLKRFFTYIWRYRNEYDGVFVHMNPEYCILGGWLWRLLNKKVLLWYTHRAVNIRLRLGAFFATKIFTASPESFRLKSKKVEVVGHGIDVETISNYENRAPVNELRLLVAGRVSRVKNLETVVRGVNEVSKRFQQNRESYGQFRGVSLTFIGDTITRDDEVYKLDLENLRKELIDKDKQFLHWIINFEGGIDHWHFLQQYQDRHILIHTSRTGSMDKVVLEALAAGRIVITSSEAYAHLAGKGFLYTFPAGDYQKLAETIETVVLSGALAAQNFPNKAGMEYVRENHNLDKLIKKIVGYFTDQKTI